MSTDHLSYVRYAIQMGDEATIVLSGNRMEAVNWLLRQAGFELESESEGMVSWEKPLAAPGSYRTADVVFLAASSMPGELFDESCTVFSQWDTTIRTFWSEP